MAKVGKIGGWWEDVMFTFGGEIVYVMGIGICDEARVEANFLVAGEACEANQSPSVIC